MLITDADLPQGWTVAASPVPRARVRALSSLVPPRAPINSWHEIESTGARVLLAISESDDFAPTIEAMLITPGSNPFNALDGAALRGVPVAEIDRAFAVQWNRIRLAADPAGQSDEPLTRPDRSNPEAFYLRVANAYLRQLSTTQNPTRALADEADVPHATAQRWVVEARRRGYLSPARKGRAG